MNDAGDDEIELVEQGGQEEVFHLAGAILAKRPPRPEAVFDGLKRAWESFNDDDIRIIPVNDRIYSIIVKLEATAKSILGSGPWNIDNRLMNIVTWPRDLAIDEVDFSPIQFWVHIKNLPLGMLSEGSGWNIGRRIGKVVEVEDPIKFPRTFLRVKVNVDGRKPLCGGFWYPKLGKDRRKIKIGYERLKDFCYRCGRIGHAVKFFNAAAGGGFWDDLGGRSGDDVRDPHAHAKVRSTLESWEGREEVLDSVITAQLARSIGPRQHRESNGNPDGSSRGSDQHQSLNTGGGIGYRSRAEVSVDMDNAELHDSGQGPTVVSQPNSTCSQPNDKIILPAGPQFAECVEVSPTVKLSSALFHTPVSGGSDERFMEMKTKYCSPVELLDFSDSEPMGTPQYTVKEVSDDEDMTDGALVPVVVKNMSPIQSEVGLSVVFDRLLLKRKNEDEGVSVKQKRWKGNFDVMCADGVIAQSPNKLDVIAGRTRRCKGKQGKGKLISQKSQSNLSVSCMNLSGNLADVPVKFVNSWIVSTPETGCGGGPNSTTRYLISA